eukprot:7312452-Lingulodinium_polyedra.AAC.1
MVVGQTEPEASAVLSDTASVAPGSVAHGSGTDGPGPATTSCSEKEWHKVRSAKDVPEPSFVPRKDQMPAPPAALAA